MGVLLTSEEEDGEEEEEEFGRWDPDKEEPAASGDDAAIGGCRTEGARSARAPPMLCDVCTPDICAADRRKVTPHSTWYSVPTKRPEAKQAHAPEIFAISAEDLREDKKSSQYLPSWDYRLFVEHKAQPPPQPRIPDMIGHAPGETVTVKGKGAREKGGNASLPGDSRVSRRIRPLAILILFKKKTSSCCMNRRAPAVVMREAGRVLLGD
eukprot:scaffold3872_cov123-Isochrysis_galbana.AAC.5